MAVPQNKISKSRRNQRRCVRQCTARLLATCIERQHRHLNRIARCTRKPVSIEDQPLIEFVFQLTAGGIGNQVLANADGAVDLRAGCWRATVTMK